MVKSLLLDIFVQSHMEVAENHACPTC
jgi:hypothetical protein